MSLSTLSALALALSSSLVAASDSCTYATESTCNAANDCSWCVSAAVPSSCKTLNQAKSLPQSVFKCAKVESPFKAEGEGVTHIWDPEHETKQGLNFQVISLPIRFTIYTVLMQPNPNSNFFTIYLHYLHCTNTTLASG